MIEKFDILTLANNKDYTVAEQLYYNDKEYLLLIEVDADENLLQDKMIVERVKTEDGYIVKDIKDKEIYKEVKQMLLNMLYLEQ